MLKFLNGLLICIAMNILKTPHIKGNPQLFSDTASDDEVMTQLFAPNTQGSSAGPTLTLKYFVYKYSYSVYQRPALS